MSTPTFKVLKPTSEAEKVTHTALDTIEVTMKLLDSWKLPPFQRPLRVNGKVVEVSEVIKRDDGIIPGVITIGIIRGDDARYVIDGQHRREAFRLSECQVGYVDVRYRHFADMAEMGEEFVNINSKIVNMKPDDILRGLEPSHDGLAKIRRRAPYVGYDQIRRSEKSPLLSMSALLRCWFGSQPEAPATTGTSAMTLVRSLSVDEADQCVAFLDLAFTAFGRDPENARLWGNLNLCLCAWLYRRLVITPYSPRTPKNTREQFTKCLMSLAADATYNEWLVGRQLRERDRSPAYRRVKDTFAKRLEADLGKKVVLPAPAWASHSGGAK